MQRALSAAILNFCILIIHCNDVTVLLTLGETKTVNVSNGKTLSIKCKLNSGSFDATQPRSWVANGAPLIDDGIISTAGSGYTEILHGDGFTLVTPALTYSFDGTQYQCSYGFSQANVDVRIYDIGRTDQSNGECIDGKSIDKCWFSLSTVIPEITSPQNLSVSYEDGTMEDINSLLNVTSQLNADGKTRDYFFKISSASFSKDVKAIELSFIAGPISRTLTIVVVDCSLDIILCGLLPVFLIVLTVSIVFIIILKKECLPKQFGELTKKKLGIIVAFILVAIIIGVCLGLLIKGCDKKFLALGLSILFAIIIVVAFILILFFYHKKFESRKGSQGGQGQDNNGESQNNTGSNTTKNATERVGNKAGVPKGEQSALKQKEINTPLPSPPSQPQTAFTHNLPMSRTNQLPPLAKENEEVNTVEKKKKKKKKKRKKSEEAGENVDKIQDDDNDN